VAFHRKRPYSPFMSSLRGTNPSSSKQDDRSYPPTPVFTSEQSITRQSWELRRARSKSVLASHRRGSGERPPPLPKGFLCNACDCTFLCDLSHATTPSSLACSLTHNSHSWLLVSPFTHVPPTQLCRPCFATSATALSTDGTFGDSPPPGVGNRQEEEHARQWGPQHGCSC